MINNLVTVIRTLTILPIPGKDTMNFPSCLPYFPFGGALIAVFTLVFFHFAQLLPDIPLLPGLITAGAIILVTGALHIDGLADVADGFAGGKDKARILEIFKDPRLGTFGVTVLVIDVFIKVIMYTWYNEQNFFWVIALSLVLSRSFQALALAFLPSATPGRGIASSFVDSNQKVAVLISFLLSLSLCYLFVDWRILLCITGCTFFFLTGFSFFCLRKIGGITGDCIGSINEIAEVTILISGSFFVKAQFVPPVLKILKCSLLSYKF